MKIAVPALGNNPSSEIDRRFGRTRNFIIFDTESMDYQAIPNPHINAQTGAGIASAQLVAESGADLVLTNECGVHAFNTLSELGVKVVTDVTGTVSEAIGHYLRSPAPSAASANIECPATCPGNCSVCAAGNQQPPSETSEIVPVLAETPMPEIRDFTPPVREKLTPGIVISFASGKGGTGKTLVSTSLALSAGRSISFFDCDIEEPNAHIFLLPRYTALEDVLISSPEFNLDICTYCGRCAEVCKPNAIAVVGSTRKLVFFPELCNGCGACFYVCGPGAISEGKRSVGKVRKGEVSDIKFFSAELDVGEQVMDPLISEVKFNIDRDGINLIDSPPGNARPMILSVMGSDYCVLVAEPTPFGLHDMKLSIRILKTLDIPFGVVINKDGTGNQDLEDFCISNNIEVLLKIPYDMRIAELYSRGMSFVREDPEWAMKFREMFRKIIDRPDQNS